MRRSVVRTKARWIPDAAAAVDVVVWEAIQRGVTDWQGLYDAARYGAIAHRRYEMRHRRPPPLPLAESVDLAERVAERLDAARAVVELQARVGAPEGAVVTWLERKLLGDGDRMPSRVKNAGQRWSLRARSKLAAAHEVA